MTAQPRIRGEESRLGKQEMSVRRTTLGGAKAEIAFARQPRFDFEPLLSHLANVASCVIFTVLFPYFTFPRISTPVEALLRRRKSKLPMVKLQTAWREEVVEPAAFEEAHSAQGLAMFKYHCYFTPAIHCNSYGRGNQNNNCYSNG